MKSVRPPLVKVTAKVPTGVTGFDQITGGGPVQSIVGTLSQTQTVSLVLGLPPIAA